MPDGEAEQISTFVKSAVKRPTLALVYGRRRIGKSTMLVELSSKQKGFYFEATRVATPVHLERLGQALGEFQGTGRIALGSWEEAIAELFRLGEQREIPVVLDEFGYIIEADASVPSVIAAALGPAALRNSKSRSRLVLCGSAIAMMRSLTEGQAPLRGRAGLELIMQANDFRIAASRLPNSSDLLAALQTYAVIGGVVGYATDMVDFDLPKSVRDFDRWVIQRVLNPAATLHHEATTLLAEDPMTSGKGALLYRGVFEAIANGSVTAGTIAKRNDKTVGNIAPALNRLVDAGIIARHEDPIRSQRPLYTLNDPFLQFHFAVLDPYVSLLRDQDIKATWNERLRDVYRSKVRGPVFEEQARLWVRRFASPETLAVRDHVGPSSVVLDAKERQLDVMVARNHDLATQRSISGIGEAKSGELIDRSNLRHLERVRASFGDRALGAKLFFFGTKFHKDLVDDSKVRVDIELVDPERLYHGS